MKKDVPEIDESEGKRDVMCVGSDDCSHLATLVEKQHSNDMTSTRKQQLITIHHVWRYPILQILQFAVKKDIPDF